MLKKTAKAVIANIAPSLLHRRHIRRLAQAERELHLLPALCRADRLAVDVGANLGLYVHHLLPLCKSVIAFEPLPAMQATLRTHYGSQIKLEAVALSDEEGTAELRVPIGNYSWASMATTNQFAGVEAGKIATFSVSMQRLDSFALEDVGFIKIDVEGHEEAVLRGAMETIRRSMPNLVIETEERHNVGAPERVVSFLAELGYVALYLDAGDLKLFSDFDSARDQPLQNVSVKGKTGRYINNFVFIPSEGSASVIARMRQLL